MRRQSTSAFPGFDEELVSCLLETASDLVMITGADGKVLFLSPSCERVLGHDPQDLLGRNPQIVHPDDLTRVREAQKRGIRCMDGGELEYRVRTHSGETRWLSHTWMPICRDGKMALVVNIVHNITDRKHTEESLRSREDQFRELVENLEEGIGVVDAKERFILVNPAGERIFGVRPGTLAGRSLMEFVDGQNADVLQEQTGKRRRGEKNVYELWIRRPDGQERLLHLSAVPRYDESGTFIGTLGNFRDITDSVRLREELERYRDRLEERVAERTEELSRTNERLKREMDEREKAERKLLQLQKMDAIGTLAGGIAHDFNNIMTNILGQTELAARTLREDDPLSERLVEIRGSANHAVNLTRQLLMFGRRQPLEPRTLDVNSVLGDMLRMLERVIGEDVKLVFLPDPDLWPVSADRGNLEQVVMNLALNARDAMPDGGSLRIVTSNVTIAAGDPQAPLDLPAGPYVKLGFQDQGTGMDQDVQQRIFEPFFTTKDTGVGTGLGLSVVYGIVARHDGAVDVKSRKGRGTTMSVLLPALPEEGVSAQEERTSSEGIFSGAGRILLVEDNDGARRFAVHVLEEAGYEVVAAEDVSQAMAVLENEDQPFDLLFSDVVLPDGDGVSLASTVLEMDHGIGVLLTSGYTDDRSRWDVIQDRSYAFLQKPYPMDVLLEAVQKNLARR